MWVTARPSFRAACPGDPEIHHLVGSSGSSPWKGADDGARMRPELMLGQVVRRTRTILCSRDDQVVLV